MAEFYPISQYLDIFDSDNAPPIPRPELQQYDNYQIYSLVCCDYPGERTYLRKSRIGVVAGGYQTGNSFGYTATKDFDDSSPFTFTSNGEASKGIAYQRFSVTPIPINFDTVAAKLNIKPRDTYSYRYLASRSVMDTFSDNLQNGSPYPANLFSSFEIYPDAQSFDINPYNYVQLQYNESGSRFEGTFVSSRVYSLMQDISADVGGSITQLDMFALVGGYSVDPRTKPDSYPRIKPTKTGSLSISYYRNNPYEKVENFISLDWRTYNIELQKDREIYLPLIDPVFGTLILGGDPVVVADVKAQLITSVSGKYKWSDYYEENIDTIVGEWKAIYDSLPAQTPAPANLNVFGKDYVIYDEPIQRVVSANNNYWNNDANSYTDINFAINHPLFIVKNKRAYDWYILDQTDGSYGDLTMDSPRIVEIHKALEAGKYSLNELDKTKDRIPTLGHLIERASSLLGYRPDANGKVDRVKEKEDWIRKQINKRDPSVLKSIQDGDYSPVCFATKGMMIKRLPNEIDRGRIVEGHIEKVHDIPQILASILDQLNESLGIQEGSNINIPLSNKGKAVYPNQLALLIDIARTLAEINEYTRQTRITAMVTHQQVGEILAATGLEPIAKFIEISSDGGTKAQIPYWGIHPKESLRTSIDNVTANVGILLGQIGV